MIRKVVPEQLCSLMHIPFESCLSVTEARLYPQPHTYINNVTSYSLVPEPFLLMMRQRRCGLIFSQQVELA